MSNLTLFWNNKSDSAALSGGSWVAALPLSNMQTKILKLPARSVGLLPVATQFTIDLLSAGKNYDTIAVLSHNLSTTALIRVRCSHDVSFATTDFDSGWKDAYDYSIPTPEAMWEESNWWSGKPTNEDLNGYSLNTILFTEFLIDSRYIKIEVNDADNAHGAIDIGRLMIAPRKEFLVNYSYGASIKWNDESTATRSLGGTPFFNKQQKYRSFNCAAKYLEDAEALASIFEMQKNTGITEEVFVIQDTDDSGFFRTSFLATMSELSGIENGSII